MPPPFRRCCSLSFFSSETRIMYTSFSVRSKIKDQFPARTAIYKLIQRGEDESPPPLRTTWPFWTDNKRSKKIREARRKGCGLAPTRTRFPRDRNRDGVSPLPRGRRVVSSNRLDFRESLRFENKSREWFQCWKLKIREMQMITILPDENPTSRENRE